MFLLTITPGVKELSIRGTSFVNSPIDVMARKTSFARQHADKI